MEAEEMMEPADLSTRPAHGFRRWQRVKMRLLSRPAAHQLRARHPARPRRPALRMERANAGDLESRPGDPGIPCTQ
jgi:hypothetical protein